MARHWFVVVGCILVVTAPTMAMPTQDDTLVVARSDDVSTAAESTEVTTQESNLPIKLTEMDVESDITMRFSHTAVVTKVRNPAKVAQEATFRVLLPEAAYISGFVMTLDGKSYKAYVKEKEAAKKDYEQAVSQGVGAGLVTAKARDSNQFIVTVNVEPFQVAVFNLTYEELLARRNGVYNHAINLYPGTVVPKLTVTVNIKENQKITVLRVPELRTGNEIDATDKDPQNKNAVVDMCDDDHQATVTFNPNLEEQKRLMEIYNEKSKESESGRGQEAKEGILGQFVVQYDVDRPANGEILVNDGYFVHFDAPESLPALPKLIQFVLDTSGSMTGRKIEQLRQAMQVILSDLNEDDYFSLVQFHSTVKVLDLNDALKEPTKNQFTYYYEETKVPVKLLPPSRATKENIDKAKVLASRLVAAGGTNIAAALDVALDLTNRGVDWTETSTGITYAPEPDSTSVAPTEDTNSPALPTPVASTDFKGRQMETIIVFLTDGEPTVGETNRNRIINRVTEKNIGANKASIFSLAFGSDADDDFLRKLSLRNDGFMRRIYEAADAALQLADFYKQISSPLLADVNFVYPADQVKEKSLTKHRFRTYYAGSELIVAGQIVEGSTEVSSEVVGWCGVEDGYGRRRYVIRPKVPVPAQSDVYLPLERLWAYLTVKQKLDERDAADGIDDKKKQEAEKEALDIALRYSFVTPLTSLVVVKPNATNAVDPESVDNQNNNRYYLQQGAFAAPQYLDKSNAVALSFRPMASNSFRHTLRGEGFHLMPSFKSAASYDFDQAIQIQPSAPPAPPSTTPANPLHPYHLDNYQWTLDVLDGDNNALKITVNGAPVSLKLTKDAAAPKSASGDADCAMATDGSAGLCVYLTRCNAAQNITSTDYNDIYCFVDNSFAGVCCPKTSIDVASNP